MSADAGLREFLSATSRIPVILEQTRIRRIGRSRRRRSMLIRRCRRRRRRAGRIAARFSEN